MTVPCPTPILIGFEGTRLHQTLQQHLSKINPAGIVLFKRNIVSLAQTRQLINEVRDFLGPVIVAIDHEGGLVSRFPDDCPFPPSPMALSRAGDPQLLLDACFIQAELLAYLGINLNFAPVLDLSTDLRNPAIGTRAFSGNPDEVADYGKTCLAAHNTWGIGSTGKHFPGHGRSVTDSHLAAGEVAADIEILRKKDLVPFQDLISSGIPAVMMAHLVFPALDPEAPAMFSRKIVTELLRNKMGFQGLVISDCVEMSAIGGNYQPEQIARNGITAGVDLFISSFSLKKSTDFQVALKQALDAAVQEAPTETNTPELLKERLQVFQHNYPGIRSDDMAFILDPGKTLSIHRQTIEKIKSHSTPDPFHDFFLLELQPNSTDGINAGEKPGLVAGRLMTEMKSIRQHRILVECDPQLIAEVVEIANQKKMTIVFLTVNGFQRDGYSHFVRQLKRAKSAIVISLGDERNLTGELENEWVTWGYNAWTAKALVQELESA